MILRKLDSLNNVVTQCHEVVRFDCASPHKTRLPSHMKGLSKSFRIQNTTMMIVPGLAQAVIMAKHMMDPRHFFSRGIQPEALVATAKAAQKAKAKSFRNAWDTAGEENYYVLSVPLCASNSVLRFLASRYCASGCWSFGRSLIQARLCTLILWSWSN